MALKAILDSLDDVEEAIKPFYAEKDGKFILQVTGVDDLPDVRNLKTAYEGEKDKRRKKDAENLELTNKINAFPEDFDAEVWNKAKNGKPDEAANEAQLVALRQTLEAERDEWKGKYEGEVDRGRKAVLQTTLGDALSGVGVTDPAFLKASRTMLESSVKFTDEGKPIVESDMGPMPLTDYVARWADGEGKAFIAKPAGTGTESKDSKAEGGSPVNKELAAKVPGFADLPP